MSNDEHDKFAWGLHWDTAFLRTCASCGFETLEEAVKEGWAKKAAESTLAVRNKYTDMSLDEFLNLERWPLHDQRLHIAISVYEDWLWQLAHWYVNKPEEEYPEEGEVHEFNDIKESLRQMVTWQVSCDSQSSEFKAGVQDWNRLDKGQKMTLDEIYKRVHPHMSGGRCSYREHPDYPLEVKRTDLMEPAKKKSQGSSNGRAAAS